MSFKNKVALITAGAAGIGAATAEAFAKQGASVMIADINSQAAEAVIEKLRNKGASVAFVLADASDENAIAHAVEQTVKTFGGLDVAANIVGYAHPESIGADFHLQSGLGWDETQSVSLRSVFLAMKHEINYMLEHGGGAICNVSSLAALTHVADSGVAYAVAKTGVIKLSKFAAVNYGQRGIRVNCIAPGTTPTEAFQKIGPEADAFIAQLIEKHAIKRAIEPSEQAEAITWLCSDAAAMVTGQVLPVDGGWSAHF